MKTIVGSVIAATGASACCLSPVALSSIGAGALGAAAAKLEPFRPLFLTATVVLLGAGFIVTYRRTPSDQCGSDVSCAPSSRRTAKVVLWLATIAVILLVAFPYYINAGSQAAIAGEVQQASTCTLKVTGMTCGGCAAAVERAANEVDGVKDTAVSYDEGLAEVTYDPAKTSPEAIARAIAERSGYNAEVQSSEAR